jgi:hypothetical protein
MKIVSGDFTGDGKDDIAIGHKLADTGQGSGMGVHVFYGGVGTADIFKNADTSWKVFAAPGWLWNNMKLAAGPFNGDNNADLAVVYNNAGINIHFFKGGSQKFGNASTNPKVLPAPDWDWNLTKLAAGQFNSDVYADIALLHKLTRRKPRQASASTRSTGRTPVTRSRPNGLALSLAATPLPAETGSATPRLTALRGSSTLGGHRRVPR